MRGYLIDVEHGEKKTVDVDDTDQLKQLYQLIGCDCIDIAKRRIGGLPFNIVVDDEGFLRDAYRTSALTGWMRPALAGNIVIFGIGAEGDLADLTDEEVGSIERATCNIVDVDLMCNYPAVIIT